MRKRRILIWVLIVGLYGCSDKQVYDEMSVPDEHRFSQEVFLNGLDEPVELEVLPDGKILFVERKGGIKLFDPKTYRMVQTDSLPVFFGFEDGLMGLAIDPNFSENNWIYLYYAPIGDDPKQHLSRFTWTDEGIKEEQLMLVVPTQRDECCHTGGSIEFGPDGLLYLSTGDDTNPFEAGGFGPMDDRVGRKSFDARGTSSNTNDLRGKVLRIRPETDGSYTIPEGNLFVDNDPKTLPEIYVMGCRNPYRITIDQKRNWLFWGDVGPDAGENDVIRGPRGHDEMNVARSPGYYGWPMFVGNNLAYGDWDFARQESDGFFNPEKPVNDSRFNTGIEQLPPAREAMIYYPYATSDLFPMLDGGGRTAMTGPVFYSDSSYTGQKSFPSYFNERLFIYDWIRDWIFTVKVDDKGQASDFQPFMPGVDFANIIDMTVGPDGRLYMIEYGTTWFKANDDARLSRINFDRENRVPHMQVDLSVEAGSSPLTVTLDASKSVDYDGDELEIVWDIEGEKFESAVVTRTFVEEGIYRPRLSIRDGKGHHLMESFKIEVGNDAPDVSIDLQGNQSFYWEGRRIEYEVNVSDKQDGLLGKGIAEKEVNFDVIYMDGFDQAQLLGHQMPVSSGETLINNSDCMACHKVASKSVGPSFVEVSRKYKENENAVDNLSAKIIKGGSGVWGDHSMSAHPDFTVEEAASMVAYILAMSEEQIKLKPLKGVFVAAKKSRNNTLVFSAQYEDQGGKGLSSITTVESSVLRNVIIPGTDFDESEKIELFRPKKGITKAAHGSWFMYRQMDLISVSAIAVSAKMLVSDSVILSIRKGAIDGPILGSVSIQGIKGKLDEHLISLKSTTGKADIYVTIAGTDQKNNLIQFSTLTFIINEQQ